MREPLDSSDIYLDPLEQPITKINALRHERKAAYFDLNTGAYYHGRLCHLMLGMQRGSSKNFDNAMKQLMRFIQQHTGSKPEYHLTKILDQKKGVPRTHGHFLISMPFIPQYILLKHWEKYLGEQGSLFIRLIPEGTKRAKAIQYAMHYNLKQKGIPRYSRSKHWLPSGTKDEWKKIKRDIRRGQPNILKSPEWRAAMIQSLHQWIDEHRIAEEQTEIGGDTCHALNAHIRR